jgi:hypothetical protein
MHLFAVCLFNNANFFQTEQMILSNEQITSKTFTWYLRWLESWRHPEKKLKNA